MNTLTHKLRQLKKTTLRKYSNQELMVVLYEDGGISIQRYCSISGRNDEIAFYKNIHEYFTSQ